MDPVPRPFLKRLSFSLRVDFSSRWVFSFSFSIGFGPALVSVSVSVCVSDSVEVWYRFHYSLGVGKTIQFLFRFQCRLDFGFISASIKTYQEDGLRDEDDGDAVRDGVGIFGVVELADERLLAVRGEESARALLKGSPDPELAVEVAGKLSFAIGGECDLDVPAADIGIALQMEAAVAQVSKSASSSSSCIAPVQPILSVPSISLAICISESLAMFAPLQFAAARNAMSEISLAKCSLVLKENELDGVRVATMFFCHLGWHSCTYGQTSDYQAR